MPGIGTEFAVFLHAVLTGIFAGSVYLSLRVLRRLIAHKLWMINVEDAIYWGFMSLYVFVQIYHTSDGTIRWYFVLGVAVGIVFMRILSFFARRIHEKIYVFIRKKSGKGVD